MTLTLTPDPNSNLNHIAIPHLYSGLSNLCRDAETDAETVFTPETPRRTLRHFERRRDGRQDKGFCDIISMPN